MLYMLYSIEPSLAMTPDEGETLNDYVKTWPKDFLKTGVDNVKPDSGGNFFIIQDKFRESFAQDVDGTEADIMAAVQKPPSQSIFAEKSGSPALEATSSMVSGI